MTLRRHANVIRRHMTLASVPTLFAVVAGCGPKLMHATPPVPIALADVRPAYAISATWNTSRENPFAIVMPVMSQAFDKVIIERDDVSEGYLGDHARNPQPERNVDAMRKAIASMNASMPRRVYVVISTDPPVLAYQCDGRGPTGVTFRQFAPMLATGERGLLVDGYVVVRHDAWRSAASPTSDAKSLVLRDVPIAPPSAAGDLIDARPWLTSTR